jgi:transcriptional regulator with XRE-family HTH domain
MDTRDARNGIVIPARIVDGDFAGWLRASMAERGMTTRGLAMRSGIDHTTISRLMRGDRDPKLATVVALLRVLGPQPLWGASGHAAGTPAGVAAHRLNGVAP